ncbi:hypothetical protein ACFONG_02400 [Uliginosibacterium paludis]|uniref:Lipoprotein n=1 Tax=Uliginosibacterium paludis TaxID=1615952 RepID=A0ABV2CPI5_9RHOO
MNHAAKLAASSLILALTLAACGGGGGSDDAPAPTAPGSSSSSKSSSSTSTSSQASSSSSSVATSSSSSSAPAVTVKEWGFSNEAYAAAGQTLFSADYTATADNSVKLISSDIASGAVTVDGLQFNTTAAGVLRYRAAGSSSNNGTGAVNMWNTNGSFYSSNAALIPDVGADGSAPASGSKLRAYMGVPVTAKKALSIAIEYRQTSASATAGKLALFCSDNSVLIKQDVFSVANADGSFNTLSYTADASHNCSELRVIYGREGTSSGGVNIGKIKLTQ